MKKQVRPSWAKLSPSESGIDEECLVICEAMNELPGIETYESCCGHDEQPFRVFFHATLEGLPPLLYYIDPCHCGFTGWSVQALTDCAMSPVHFVLIGPIGEQAYEQSEVIAKQIENWLHQNKT